MNVLLAAVALGLGVLLTTQVGSNTMLGKSLANSYIPAVVNMTVGLVLTSVLLLIVHKPLPSHTMVREATWWTWFAGGSLGTIYLIGNILLAPKLGAAALVGLVVTGQLIFAVLADHYGWLGFEQHSASLWRGAGCLLMVGGITLIAKF